jgi:myo-inositol 2-dehydrogenase/D-chiro-inositol 1-dehydrogenase
LTKDALRVRLGVVGCGRVAELQHLPALRNVRGAEVTALADADPARLESTAERFRVARRYADYRELIASGDVNAVAVCVPPKLHAEVALAALEAGKHVFVEKPLALGLDECRLLSAKAAERDRLKVLVGFNLRRHRLVRAARETIRRGELGEVTLVRTVFTSGMRLAPDYPEWRRRRETGGGALFELGVHHFDLLRFLLSAEVEEVYASSLASNETATVAARMSGDVQVLAAFSEGTGENHEIEVYGRHGWLRVSCYRSDGLERFGVSQYPGALGARVRRMGRTLLELPRMMEQSRRGGDYVASYTEQWRHFVEAVTRDLPVECTLADGTRALEIALAAWESSATGRAVKIN